jgi:hypothetical protein
MENLKALTKAAGFPLILVSALMTFSGCGGGAASQMPGTTSSQESDRTANVQSADLSNVRSAAATTGDVVQGCQLFPADDFWNLDISRAPVDENSSAIMATAVSGANNAHLSNVYQSQYLNVVEYNEKAGTVRPQVSYHDFPVYTGAPSGGWPIGSGNPQLAIEGGDRYMNILQRAGGGHPCWLWSIYNASYSGSALSGYGGAGYPLNVAVTQTPPGCSPVGEHCSAPGSTDMMQRPFYARVDEIIAGSLTHAVDGEFPVASICNSEHLYPALGSAQGNRSSNCLPGAAKIRLKASFNTSGLSGDGLVVANGLKRFGIAVVDNGCCFGIVFGKQQSWDRRNIDIESIDQAFSTIHMSDFEVVKMGPTDGAKYTYPGSAP